MSSSLSGAGPGDIRRALELRRSLIAYARTEFKDVLGMQRQIFLTGADPPLAERMALDYLLFDWMDEEANCLIGFYLDSHSDLDPRDRDILFDWLDSENSVFELVSQAPGGFLLRDLKDGLTCTVVPTDSAQAPLFGRYRFFAGRLLAVGKSYIFSDPPTPLPDRDVANQMLEAQQAFDMVATPEALEKAQIEQHAAFCEFFGTDEISVGFAELKLTLEGFQEYILSERLVSDTGMTIVEQLKKEFGIEPLDISMPPLPDSEGLREITILSDEFEGLVFLPEYASFRKALETSDPDAEMPGWRNLLWNYIKSPEISTLAFERVAESVPDKLEQKLRVVLGEDSFSIEHLYALLLHYRMPVDGIDSLEDDARLWDMLNGNARIETRKGQPASPARKSRTSGAAPRARKKKPTSRTTKSTASARAAKPGGKKGSSKTKQSKKARTPAATGSRKPAAKSARPKRGAKPRSGSQPASARPKPRKRVAKKPEASRKRPSAAKKSRR